MKKKKRQYLIFHKTLSLLYKDGRQKIINLLEESDDDDLKFQTRRWNIVNDQNNGQYGKGDENNHTIKFNTEVIKPNLIDFSDAYFGYRKYCSCRWR